jgi:hypothetical protein
MTDSRPIEINDDAHLGFASFAMNGSDAGRVSGLHGFRE